MSVNLSFHGRVWLIKDKEGKLIDDIDTDQIYHNAHLAITDIKEMGKFAFGNLEGMKDFAKDVKPGDTVIVGGNFGAGSSRQQAVDCFKSLGIACIVARSFGAIYKRNAINSGYPILTIENIDLHKLSNLDVVTVDADAQTIVRSDGTKVGNLKPLAGVQRDILEAGDLFEYAKRMK